MLESVANSFGLLGVVSFIIGLVCLWLKVDIEWDHPLSISVIFLMLFVLLYLKFL